MNKVLYSFHSERGKMGTKYYSTSFFYYIAFDIRNGCAVDWKFCVTTVLERKMFISAGKSGGRRKGGGGRSDCARFTYQIIVSLFSSLKELLSLPCDIDISPNENQLAKLGHNSPFP